MELRFGSGEPAAPDRGATALQYALMIGLIALVVVVALNRVGGGSGQTLDTAGAGIGAPDGSGSGSGGGTPGPGTGTDGTGGGGGGAGPVPVDLATSTTGSSTTVAAATSTTTAVVTTTTVTVTTTRPPNPAEAGFTSSSAVRINSSTWRAVASASVLDESGAPLAGVPVTVEVRIFTPATGTSAVSSLELRTDAHGVIDLTSGPHRRSGTTKIDYVTFAIVAVDAPAGHQWDGSQDVVSISRV